MHARVGGCGSVLWGISVLITYDYFNYSIHFHCSQNILSVYTENCWENRPNVQGKENLSAQYAVKIVSHHAAYMCKSLYTQIIFQLL